MKWFMWFVLAAPAAAYAADAPAPGVMHLSAGRIEALIGIAVALVGAIIGGLAVVRSVRRSSPGHGRRGAFVALVLGPIGLAICGFVAATAQGGVGTGHGLGGAVLGIIVGLIGMALGAVALARSRRTS